MRAFIFSFAAVLFSAALVFGDAFSQSPERTFNSATTADTGLHETIFPGLTGNQLLDSLWVHYRPELVLSYDDARDLMFTFTDNNNDQIICIFTGDTLYVPSDAENPRADYTNPLWSTEHIWPQSKGAGAGVARRDLHHLRSIRQDVNASRGNRPFAFIEPNQVSRWWKGTIIQNETPESGLGEWSRTGNDWLFEVWDSQKGDVARAMFYFYTFYRNEADAIDAEYFYIQKNELRSYHNLDIVDAVEADRNSRIETIQGNLNPFVIDSTLVRRAFFEGFDRDSGWMPKGYFVDFETGSKGNYASGNVELNGISWLFDNAIIGGDSADIFMGSRASRLRMPAIIEMEEDKNNGLGTLYFKAARSNFTGDRDTSPEFVIEYSSDQGNSWQQVGNTVSLSGVDELESYQFTINSPSEGRIRIRTTGGASDRRFNIDELTLTDFADNTFILSQNSFSGFSYAEGEGPSSPQSFTIYSNNLDPDVTSVTLQTSSGFQLSKDNQQYSRSLELTSADGVLSETTIYLRLRSGLPASVYNNEQLFVSDGNGSNLTAGLSGFVLHNSSLALIDFDNSENWAQGSGTLRSYQTDHIYIDGNFSATGGPALQQVQDEIGGEAGTNGTYAWRLRNNELVDWRISIDSGGVGRFSVDVRRWAAGVNYDVTYTSDGINWLPLFTINDSALNHSNEWMTFEGIVDEKKDNIIIRFSSDGSSERLIVDNFQWSSNTSGTYSVAIPGPTEGDYTAGEGWRLMSTPIEGSSFNDLFAGQLWLQGPGYPSNPNASPEQANLLRLNATGVYEYIPAIELDNPIGAGNGLAIYVFADDNYDGNPTPFPKILTIDGFEHSGSVVASGLHQGTDTFSLVGNPYASTILFNSLKKTNLGEVVYVYGDLNQSNSDFNPGFRSWNGIAGSLTDGLIAPFQGFLVNHSGEGLPALEFPESAKVAENGALTTGIGEPPTIQIQAELNQDLKSDIWLSFTNQGSITNDPLDAMSFYPLDYQSFLSVYFWNSDRALDIKNLPLELAETIEIPIIIESWEAADGGFSPISGDIELAWPVLRSIPDYWHIKLIDIITGDVIDMRENTRYNFTYEQLQQKNASLEHKLEMRSPELNRKSELGPRLYISITPEQPTSIPADNQLPKRITLQQNYPNPFNPTTQIRFDLPESTDVRLDVFNIQGQRVATLLNEGRSAGTHTISFDASNLSSGVYIYRLQAGAQVFTRKMTLIK
ncbi:MAG: endonuclease [Balneolia bacterium]|nr:endonuclease [Balneolia bacterium]